MCVLCSVCVSPVSLLGLFTCSFCRFTGSACVLPSQPELPSFLVVFSARDACRMGGGGCGCCRAALCFLVFLFPSRNVTRRGTTPALFLTLSCKSFSTRRKGSHHNRLPQTRKWASKKKRESTYISMCALCCRRWCWWRVQQGRCCCWEHTLFCLFPPFAHRACVCVCVCCVSVSGPMSVYVSAACEETHGAVLLPSTAPSPTALPLFFSLCFPTHAFTPTHGRAPTPQTSHYYEYFLLRQASTSTASFVPFRVPSLSL